MEQNLKFFYNKNMHWVLDIGEMELLPNFSDVTELKTLPIILRIFYTGSFCFSSVK